jgi:hypothetical protein
VNAIVYRYLNMSNAVKRKEEGRPFYNFWDQPTKREVIYAEIGEYIEEHVKDFRHLESFEEEQKPYEPLRMNVKIEIGERINDKASDSATNDENGEKEAVTGLEENNKRKNETSGNSSDHLDFRKLTKEEKEESLRLQTTISGLVLLITQLLEVPKKMIDPLMAMHKNPTVDGSISDTETALEKGNPIREQAMVDNINAAKPPVFVQVGTAHVDNLMKQTHLSKGYYSGDDFTEASKK